MVYTNGISQTNYTSLLYFQTLKLICICSRNRLNCNLIPTWPCHASCTCSYAYSQMHPRLAREKSGRCILIKMQISALHSNHLPMIHYVLLAL